MVGTYLIIDYNTESTGQTVSGCGNLKFTLWLVICMHAVNIVMGLLNLCKLETKICNQNFICALMLYEIAMLVLMQVTYFNSQYSNCIT